MDLVLFLITLICILIHLLFISWINSMSWFFYYITQSHSFITLQLLMQTMSHFFLILGNIPMKNLKFDLSSQTCRIKFVEDVFILPKFITILLLNSGLRISFFFFSLSGCWLQGKIQYWWVISPPYIKTTVLWMKNTYMLSDCFRSMIYIYIYIYLIW